MSKLQQHGGTLLGVIIGLIVGLAIAVVVALVITKGSSPFVNKVGKVDKASDSASAPIGDPNKPLYSKQDAAKDAAKEFAKDTTTPAPTGEPKPEVAKVPSAEAKPETRPADSAKAPEDKIGKLIALTEKNANANADKSADKPADAKPAKLDATEEKWTYYLQAGAFREQTDAENTRAKLALLGYEANIVEKSSDNGVLYRVRLGPYAQVEAMNKVRTKLSEAGIDVAVARNQK
jgi:cell division protein FtsN